MSGVRDLELRDRVEVLGTDGGLRLLGFRLDASGFWAIV